MSGPASGVSAAGRSLPAGASKSDSDKGSSPKGAPPVSMSFIGTQLALLPCPFPTVEKPARGPAAQVHGARLLSATLDRPGALQGSTSPERG